MFLYIIMLVSEIHRCVLLLPMFEILGWYHHQTKNKCMEAFCCPNWQCRISGPSVEITNDNLRHYFRNNCLTLLTYILWIVSYSVQWLAVVDISNERSSVLAEWMRPVMNEPNQLERLNVISGCVQDGIQGDGLRYGICIWYIFPCW